MNKFLHSINWFRGMAILFVVLSHMPSLGLTGDIYRYWASFVQNGTAFFIFIAGYLYWHLIDRYEYKQYLLSKFKNVLIPYFIIMTITVVAIYILSLFDIYSVDYAKNADYRVFIDNPFYVNGFVWHYLKGGAINVSLWFIPMIALFFVFSYVIKKISESRFFYFYVLTFLLITFLSDKGVWAHSQFIHYLGVWLFGICCKKHENFIYNNAIKISIITIIPSLMFVCLVAEYPDSHVNFSEVQKFFSIMFFLSFFMYLETIGMKIGVLDVLAKYSFGIFFIHFYFLMFSSIIFDKILKLEAGPLYVMAFFTTLVFSLSVCILVKRILPRYSRTLLGT